MKTFHELLIELNACQPAIEWAGDKTIEQVVAECHRGDWMLWLAARIDIGIQPLTLAKGHCAATVLHLMKDERSKKAVQAAIDFGEGKINKAELAAASAAAAAYAPASAAAYASAAADAAAYAPAAAAAYASAAAAYAAAYASAAADDDAAYAPSAAAAYASAAARKTNQLATADICRKYIGKLIINTVNQLLNNRNNDRT